MNIKINNSTGATYDNAGSVSGMVEYLEKENQDRPTQEKEFFFSNDKDKVRADEVVTGIDSIKKQGLRKEDAKFFHVAVSPSEKELVAIGSDPEKLRAYTRNVMDEYAKNFGKGLQGKDLVYFAKVEYQRHYKGTDEEVKEGKAKQGDLKQGNNMHVHIVVSRKDQSGKIKLSPLTNNKEGAGKVNGFNRDGFVQTCETTFDKQFSYKREREDSYQHCKTMKNGTAEEKAKERLKTEAQQAKQPEKQQIQTRQELIKQPEQKIEKKISKGPKLGL